MVATCSTARLPNAEDHTTTASSGPLTSRRSGLSSRASETKSVFNACATLSTVIRLGLACPRLDLGEHAPTDAGPVCQFLNSEVEFLAPKSDLLTDADQEAGGRGSDGPCSASGVCSKDSPM